VWLGIWPFSAIALVMLKILDANSFASYPCWFFQVFSCNLETVAYIVSQSDSWRLNFQSSRKKISKWQYALKTVLFTTFLERLLAFVRSVDNIIPVWVYHCPCHVTWFTVHDYLANHNYLQKSCSKHVKYIMKVHAIAGCLLKRCMYCESVLLM
jgi:hypothetical protein